MAVAVPGAVAGCLEFPDRVVYAELCGTAVCWPSVPDLCDTKMIIAFTGSTPRKLCARVYTLSLDRSSSFCY